jgi:hypothetical protein
MKLLALRKANAGSAEVEAFFAALAAGREIERDGLLLFGEPASKERLEGFRRGGWRVDGIRPVPPLPRAIDLISIVGVDCDALYLVQVSNASLERTLGVACRRGVPKSIFDPRPLAGLSSRGSGAAPAP